ncbi:hypothetical protein [Nostoc sp. 2RC]|uniref:hypothetical protein n=1 Tax=Nostoc sp. 2RC TaxID=2485484 RepID=UPI00162765B0|nr:hypothetical protein [Nostoc sp. 2RC]MBC1238098.1 hypothetical protein [Nostoc sp. 2RC]
MKIRRFDILKILLLSLVILIKSPALAQAEVITNPKTITINATRGENVTRTITLRTSEKVSNLKVITVDLLSADNSSVLPARTIKLTSPPTQINPQELISLPIQFELHNSSSGEFTGEIVLTYEAGEKTIPVIVRLKDPWPLPLTVLVLGILIGMAVSAYSSQGKLSDEVTVNLENLRTQIAADRVEARAFWSRADIYLNIAKQARDAKQIVEAQAAINNAKEVWHKWIQQRPDWDILFRYYDKLRQRLDREDLKEDTSALYIQVIERDLEQALQNAPVLTTANELQQGLDKISQQINTYIQLKTQLEKLKNLIGGLEDSNQRYEWEDKASKLTQRLYMLMPAQETEIQTLQSEINTGIEKVRVLEIQVFNEEKGIDGIPEVGMVIQAPSVLEKEALQVQFLTKTGKAIASLWETANGRLKLFYLSSYLISFTVLAGSGFNQLYWTKPTFGANGWGDYFALLALGFGAEATRNVVTQVARKADESSS